MCLIRIPGIKEVVLQHVVDATHYTKHGWTHEATKKLEAITTDLAGAGLSVKIHVRLGRPTDKIISLAEGVDISLILMSSHGKSLLTELLVGSYHAGCRHPHKKTHDGYQDTGQAAEIRRHNVLSTGVMKGRRQLPLSPQRKREEHRVVAVAAADYGVLICRANPV